MRWLILLALSAVAIPVADASAAGLERPVLRITGTAPQVLYGANFRPRERVVITIQSPKPTKLVVRTDRLGRFRLSLPALPESVRCHGFIVSALGAGGERGVAGMGTFGCTPSPSIPGTDA